MKKISIVLLLLMIRTSCCLAGDLDVIREQGVLRHLGVPYANFVVGKDLGLDIELMQLFAKSLGVEYRYIETTWPNVIPDLIGRKVKSAGDVAVFGDQTPIKGDVIANGLTIIPWRLKAVAYSKPTFPNQIWFVVGINSVLRPIEPSGNQDSDIILVKELMQNIRILGKKGTCLEHSLYCLKEAGGVPVEFTGKLNELVPALLQGRAEATILDVPDALVALEKWPGMIKVIGPVSAQQQMGVAFRPDNPELLQAFNVFYAKSCNDGTYQKLVNKYYPTVYEYFPDFFGK